MDSAEERGADFSGLVRKGAQANQSRFRVIVGDKGLKANPAMRQPARRTSQRAHARGAPTCALTLPPREVLTL